MSEKLTEAITFKCDSAMKRKLRIAEAFGMGEAEFIRVAILEKVEKAEAMYTALHAVFGQSKETTDDLD